jgi:signal transduction histidine kinase
VNAPVKILLVDDEVRNLDVLESVLQSPEYQLIRALTPDAALHMLLEHEFAAMVLDIQMPEMSGLELASLVKQRKRSQHIPIIFLTAYFQEDRDVLKGYGTGAVDYLTKPISPQILRSKIAVFADLYRKSRALIAANGALAEEVAQRQSAEEALRLANNELEARVQARTADLLRVNAELSQARDRALAASRAKDDFLARLSHELRTPLNPVLLLASDAATNLALPAEVRADFEAIAQNVTLEARLIDDLLDLTSITHGKVALDQRPCNVHVILRDALAMVQAEIGRKRIVVALEFRAAEASVWGDEVRLKQIFWNVLKNAAKFTPEEGSIRVGTSPGSDGRSLAIRIADTGIGMTTAEIERIFEMFSQGDHAAESGAHRFGGLGLGLAISKMLVERHAGSIVATSTGPNQGSTFTIELPLRSGTEAGKSLPGAAGPRSATGVGAGRLRRVLLVEDHEPTRTALAHLLVRRHYEVVGADSLSEARAIAAREAFDLLISDLGLPDGNGCELMIELRDRYGVMGIALTGYGMDEDVDRTQAAGFAAHLTKPVSVEDLDGALSTAVRG